MCKCGEPSGSEVTVSSDILLLLSVSRMAKRYNMRLVLKQRFSEFFEEKVKKEQHRSLMMKMMALEVKLINYHSFHQHLLLWVWLTEALEERLLLLLLLCLLSLLQLLFLHTPSCSSDSSSELELRLCSRLNHIFFVMYFLYIFSAIFIFLLVKVILEAKPVGYAIWRVGPDPALIEDAKNDICLPVGGAKGQRVFV